MADLIDGGGPADIAFAQRLLLSFLERQSKLLGDLAEAVDGADPDAVARHAHALKGAAGNVGAAVVAGLCAEAEQLAATGAWTELTRYPDLLRAASAEAAGHLAQAVTALATIDGGYSVGRGQAPAVA
jgi:HPt (histidine-containing phosphotransfer) domain-containing protein